MNRPLRITLVWLLLVAFPLQGVAAAVMMEQMACGELYIDHAAMLCQHGDTHHDGLGAGMDSAGHADVADDGVQPVGKCTACVSCCVGAVVDSEQPRWLSARLYAHVYPLIDRGPVVGFFTDGPERPPRANSA